MNELTKRADYLAAHPAELAVQTSTVKQITKAVTPLVKRTFVWIEQGIALANDWREVGIFYNELVDSLPGKRMTADFWQQMSGLFLDGEGKQISRNQLEWCSKLVASNPEPIVDFQTVLAYRQGLLGAAGFKLIGDAPGNTEHHADFYNRLFILLDVKKLDTTLKGLETDANFGPVESWPAERKNRAWLQIKPLVDRVDELAAKLRPIEV